MDVQSKVKEIIERYENDEEFRQLLEDDFGAAIELCGVSSAEEFGKALDESGLMSDEGMSEVSGGIPTQMRMSMHFTKRRIVDSFNGWWEGFHRSDR